MEAPRKLSYNELLAGMSPFLHFPEVESEIQAQKLARVEQAAAKTRFSPNEFGTIDDAVLMLTVSSVGDFKDRLKLILATTQGSLEALDRVCMVICPDDKTWAQRRKSNTSIRSIVEFLNEPAQYKGIPWYTAERFRLPPDWLGRIRQNIAAAIHKDLQASYGTKMGLALEAYIGSVVDRAGYRFEKGRVEIVDDKEVDVVVPEIRLPRILIMSSYNLTTASGQSTRAREQQAMFEQVRTYNLARIRRQEPNVQLVNVVDGGGWIARRNDLREMHLHCDYALSFSQLDMLPGVLHFHMRSDST